MDQDFEPLAHFPSPLELDFRKVAFDVVALRRRLRLSQTEFARRFGFSVATLRHWELGRRRPRGPALSLLREIAYNPAVVVRAISRAHQAFRVRPDPRTTPSPVPRERGRLLALEDDVDI